MNSQAFRGQYVKYGERLRYAILGVVRNQEEAEDIAAWAFATAFRKRKDFRGESTFYTWVFRIALNHALSLSRRKPFVSLDAMEGPEPASCIEPDLLARTLERGECCSRIRKTLRQMPTKYRRTLVKHFVRRQKVRCIAQQEKIPKGTVLSRLFTAKRIMRAAMERQQ